LIALTVIKLDDRREESKQVRNPNFFQTSSFPFLFLLSLTHENYFVSDSLQHCQNPISKDCLLSWPQSLQIQKANFVHFIPSTLSYTTTKMIQIYGTLFKNSSNFLFYLFSFLFFSFYLLLFK